MSGAEDRGFETRDQNQTIVVNGGISLAQIPVRVDLVNIDGICRTKDDFVKRSIAQVLTATNFDELVFKATEVQKNLERIGCFKKVKILIDTNRRVDATEDGYEVTFLVNELGRFMGGINTMIGANEGSVVFGFRLPNLLGRGEKFTLEHTMGSNKDKSSHISLSKPLPGIRSGEISATLFHNRIPNSFSGFNLIGTGGLLDFTFETGHQVRHNMQWEGVWRELEAASRTTSFAVRSQCGHSFKSALRHILTIDYRDEPIFPTSGGLIRMSQEYAGLGGDIAYVKHDSEIQYNIALPFETVFQGCFRLGLLRPLDSKSSNYNISDLYYLGGPQTIRGFEMKSIGSRSENDMLGGKAYWATGLHMYAPLPFGFGRKVFDEYVRTHAFFNVGNISQPSTGSDDLSECLKTLMTDVRASYGLGIAIRIGQAARIEFNYCWPLRFIKGDKLVKGFQFGLGIEYL